MMRNWEEIQHGFQTFAACMAMIMHYILIKLIIYKSPKQIGDYKKLMLLISIFEVIYAILDVIVQPIFHSFGATFMLIVNTTHSHVVKKFWEIMAVIYCGFFGSSMAIFSIHYIYRYWVLSQNQSGLKWFKGRKVFIWFIAPLTNGLIWAFVGYFSCYPRQNSNDYLRDNVKVKLGLDIDKIVYYAPYFYERNETGHDVIYWPSFVGISLDSLSINISLIYVFYYGIACWRKIVAAITSTSKTSQILENQLFYALVAQTAIPVLLMHIPALTMFMFSFFDIDAGHLSGVVSITIALFPALDPIPTILIIPSYRKAVHDYINSICTKASKASTMFSVSETIQTGVQKACASIALSLNTLLIYLIIYKSPKELGAYKYLMIFISVLEAVYAIVDVFVSPVIHHAGFTFLLITRLESAWFGYSIQLILSGVYCGLYGACMAMFGIHFIYRYLVIKGNAMLKTFRSWRILFWFLIPVLYGGVWGSIAVLFCGPRAITNRLVEMDILENLDLKMSDIVYVAPYIFDENHDIYWPTVLGLIVDFMIINSSFFTVVYFGVLLFTELRSYTVKNNNLSDKNKTLQTQLYYSLVTQTLIPIILLQLPVTILFITVFFSFNFGEFSGLVSMTIAIYPAIDPLPTMFIVTSYRNSIGGFFKQILRKMLCRKKKLKSTTRPLSVDTTRL